MCKIARSQNGIASTGVDIYCEDEIMVQPLLNPFSSLGKKYDKLERCEKAPYSYKINGTPAIDGYADLSSSYP